MLLKVQSIILAAGKSSRFNTNKTKLTEKICGQSMILYQLSLLQLLKTPIIVVVGHQKEQLQDEITQALIPDLSFVVQEEQKGTGHALKCTQHLWQEDHILIMNADIPLITQAILEQLYNEHINSGAALTFVTSHDNNPYNSYGRVIKKEERIEIIEAKHLNNLQEYCCVNAGIYIAKRTFLEQHISAIKANEQTNEYYITDLVKIAVDHNETVNTINVPLDFVRGINTLEELWAAEQIKRSELIRNFMHKGVRFSSAQNVHIDLRVTIGAGSSIGTGVHLTGSTTIGSNTVINPFCIIENSTLEDNVIVHSHSIIKDCVIKKSAQVGPFAHLRDGSLIQEEARVGTFVEVKNSSLGIYSKACHLTYLGDTNVGTHVNIGAGTVTANYDGQAKHQTIIEDEVLVGANNSIVAPVTIGKGAITAAGSTITDAVPENALAIARARQINKEEYALLLRQKTNEEPHSKNEYTHNPDKVTYL